MATGTFGTETVCSTQHALNVDKAVGLKCSTGLGGYVYVTKVYAYLDGNGAGSGNQEVRACIYDDSGSSLPEDLLGYSDEVIVTDGASWSWVEFTFSTPVYLNNSTVWLLLHSGYNNATIQLKYTATGGPGCISSGPDEYADGPEDPFESGYTSYPTRDYSIYAYWTDTLDVTFEGALASEADQANAGTLFFHFYEPGALATETDQANAGTTAEGTHFDGACATELDECLFGSLYYMCQGAFSIESDQANAGSGYQWYGAVGALAQEVEQANGMLFFHPPAKRFTVTRQQVFVLRKGTRWA